MENCLREQINNFIREDEGMKKLADKDFMMISLIGIVVASWEDYKKNNGV